MTAAASCPGCHGSGIDPDSRPTYHDGAPGIPDPAGYEPCRCVLAQDEINAAIERVVKSSSDHQALTEAVRILAGELGYGLVPKGAEPVVHRYFGGHWNFGTWVAACGQPDPSHSVTRFGGEITCPGCLASLSDGGIEPDPQPVAAEFLDRLHATTAVEHEDGPEPTPRDGEHGTCAACGGAIRYIDCPTGGWWAHETHPADGHDAELGGPA